MAHLTACDERQLRDHPLCRYCAEWGIVTRATTCDHRDGTFISLCERCKVDTARMIALYGYRLDIGLDGYPLDRNHPANRRR